MSERTRWNEDEKERLMAAALPLLVADKRMLLVDAVRRVQDTVLPVDRRRDLRNIGSLPAELRSQLEQRRAAALGNTKTVPVEDYQALQGQLVEATRSADHLAEQLREAQGELVRLRAQPVPPSPLEVLQDFLAEVLRRARMDPADLVKPAHMVVTPEQLNSNGAAKVKHNPVGEHEDKPKPPVVMICGLKPEQRAYHEAHFNGRVRLRFWWHQHDSGGAQRQLEEKAKGCDMVYLLMGAVSHSTVAIVARTGVPYQRVATYSRDALRDMLDAWLTKREAQ